MRENLPGRGEVSHEPGRPQSWYDCDDDIRVWIDRGSARLQELLDSGLVGVYLHGSLAMGSHYRPKSDVDVLIVVQDALSPEQRRAVAHLLLDTHDPRPIVGGLEVSVLTAEHAGRYVHPARHELHFSEMWADAVRSGSLDWTAERSDPELAANLTTARERGVNLVGPPPSEVFGRVPFADYIAGIRCDFDWIVDGENILTTPFYGVLNACRGLMVFSDGETCVPSKDEAAQWALREELDEHRVLIELAWDCYRASSVVDEENRRFHGHSWDTETLLAFAASAFELAGHTPHYGRSAT